ncbi:glycosyltransferase [Corallococcus aberystwythensis]|uniref:Glycosyl transferase family 28 C-terminal domain-containing protein n=1 Tax=Corallococcus aberystwythensis TaxID=2316722 RepID=A0A3A8PYA8_9BACT|nr:nucleotide disphospho-sugar-binding domain-containing protein [Corallococcus aberystwythensis]RKH56304.1 hypothetical protein D7W81_34315 [Corallococcus aberystwythensis]
MKILVMGDSMSLAHVARAMVVAKKLIRDGHQVLFATGPAHMQLARSEGFDPIELFCVPPEFAYEQIRKGSHIFSFKTLKAYVDSDLAVLQEAKPDLIISDMRLSLNISSAMAKVEYRAIVSGYTTNYYALEMNPPKTLPAVGVLESVLGERLSRRLFPVVKSMTLKFYARNFNRYRNQLGLPKITNIFDVITSPHGNYIADLPEYVPCENLRETDHYIGPLLWEPSLPDPDWLSEIDPQAPVAFVAKGSTGDLGNFQRICKILLQNGWQVLAIGSKTEEMPAGVLSAPLARLSKLIQKSRVVICHGGSGTVYQSIHEGVPVVGIATFHDQEINLERVESLKWGRALHPTRWTEKDLLEAIQEVQTRPYQEAVAQGQRSIRAMVAAQEARPFLKWHQAGLE